MTTNDHGNTPPASHERVDEALQNVRLCISTYSAAAQGDAALVAAEIARLRRHSEALGLLATEMLPRTVEALAPAPGLERFAALLEEVLTHIATDPRELDLIADAIIESRRARGSGPPVEH